MAAAETLLSFAYLTSPSFFLPLAAHYNKPVKMLQQLAVRVIEARDLLAEDLNGFSDPFVAIEVLDARGDILISAGIAKTKVAKKTLAPHWDETFTIGSDRFDLRLGTTLRFMLYDFDGLKKDDILGVVDIPLDLINSEPLPVRVLNEWFLA